MRLAKEHFGEVELLGIAALGILAYVWFKGGIANAAYSAGGAIVDAAGGVIAGGVDTIGQGVGLPPLSDVTTDPYVSRYLIDHPHGGQYVASKWSSAAAYAQAQFIAPGNGRPAPAGTAIAAQWPPFMGPVYIPELDNPISVTPDDPYSGAGTWG